MDDRKTTAESVTPPVRHTLAVVAMIAACLSTGCTLMQSQKFGFRSVNAQKQCALSPDVTTPEIISHLNARTARINSWRSSHVKISYSAPGAPSLPLSADMSVKEPASFRLSGRAVAMQAVDLGSNNDKIWFWTKFSQPRHVFTCKHEDTHYVPNLPFEPKWLMDVLGVVPLDPNEQRVQQRGGSGLISLVTETKTPQGQPIRKVLLVDSCQGYIIAHELYDLNNTLVARAELNNYKVDRLTGIAMPHEISIDWPQTNMTMTLNIGEIQVNPSYIPESIWQVPAFPSFPEFDIGALAKQDYLLKSRQTADLSGDVNPEWETPDAKSGSGIQQIGGKTNEEWDPFDSETGNAPARTSSQVVPQSGNANSSNANWDQDLSWDSPETGSSQVVPPGGASQRQPLNPGPANRGTSPVVYGSPSDSNWQPEFADDRGQQDSLWQRLTAPQRHFWNRVLGQR